MRDAASGGWIGEKFPPACDHFLTLYGHLGHISNCQRAAPMSATHPPVNRQKLSLKTLDVAHTEKPEKANSDKLACDVVVD